MRRADWTGGLLGWCAAAIVSAGGCQGQTAINLGAGQARNVDFTGFSRTKPIKTGAALPSSCQPGEFFYLNQGSSAQGLYACSPDAAWRSAVETFDIESGLGIAVDGGTISVDDALVPRYLTGAGAPPTACQTGRDFYLNTTSGQLSYCRAADTWAGFGSGGAFLDRVLLKAGVRGATSNSNYSWAFSGATGTTVGTSPQLDLRISFADSASDSITTQFAWPATWDGGPVSVGIRWHAGTVNTGSVVWQARIGCLGAGDSATTISWNTAATIAAANAGNQALNVHTIPSVPVANCSPGEYAWMELSRLGSNSSDTLAGGVAALFASAEVHFARNGQ